MQQPLGPQQMQTLSQYLGPVVAGVIGILGLTFWFILKLLSMRKNGNGSSKDIHIPVSGEQPVDYWKLYFQTKQLETQKALTETMSETILPLLRRTHEVTLQLAIVAENTSRSVEALTDLVREWSPLLHNIQTHLDGEKPNGKAVRDL